MLLQSLSGVGLYNHLDFYSKLIRFLASIAVRKYIPVLSHYNLQKKNSFFFFFSFAGGQFQKVLQAIIEMFNFTFFKISGWGIDLDYCDIEWFALETKIILLLLRLNPSTAFRRFLLTMRAIPFLLRDSCQQLQI